jgi:hypothetical protein
LNISPSGLAKALGGEVRGNQVLAPGPGHSPADRSLSILVDDRAPGGFIVNAFSPRDDAIECRDYVREKAGLPDWEPQRANGNTHSGYDFTPQPATQEPFRLIESYIYHDADGTPLRKVDRKERPNPRKRNGKGKDKSFPQSHWDGQHWVSGATGVKHVPYRLPDLLRMRAEVAHDVIHLTEGERHADRLIELGIIATCCDGGAAKWYPELNQYFEGATVIIHEDNDASGRGHVRKVGESLLGTAEELRVLTFRDLAEGADILDVLQGAEGDLNRLGERVEKHCRPWSPDDGKQEDAPKGFKATPYSWIDPRTITPRQWVYGHHLIRKFLSVTVSPGGVGKTSKAIGDALAMVSGKPLLGQWVGSPVRVWLWNLEDPRDELERRIQAAAMQYGLAPADIGDRLFIDTGREQALCTAETTSKGARVLRPTIENLVTEIKGNKIDVLIVDPFVSSHQVAENDNPAIDMVAKEWGKIADRTNCAIELIHHTRKLSGDEVTSESSRGAVALISAARDVQAINRMTKEEGEKAGVDNHRAYFRVYSDKANLAPPADKSDWYKLESVELGNGDHVGVVVPWTWPDPFSDITVADLKAVQRAIDGKKLRENSQAKDWAGLAIAEVLGLDPTEKTNRHKISSCIKTWVASGALRRGEIEDEKGKKRPILEVGEWA